MARPRPRGRSRNSYGRNEPQGSPHTLVLALGVVISISLQLFGWPGGVALLLTFAMARLCAKGTFPTGKDAWGKPDAADKRERRAMDSYDGVTNLASPGMWLLPVGPSWVLAFGVGLLLSSTQRLGMGVALLDALCVCESLMMLGNMRRRKVRPALRMMTWAGWWKDANHVLCVAVGALSVWGAALLAVFGGPTVLAFGVALTLTGAVWWLPLLKAYNKPGRDAAKMLAKVTDWLSRMGKPPVGRPVAAFNANDLGGGLTECIIKVADGEDSERWFRGNLADQLAPLAEPERLRVTFAPTKDGDHTKAVMLLTPTAFPGMKGLDAKQARGWLVAEYMRVCRLWNVIPGRIGRMSRISSDSWVFEIVGGETSPFVINRDWLQGTDDDLGFGLKSHVVQDPSPRHFYWLLGSDDGYDDKAACKWRDMKSPTLTKDTGTKAYLALVSRAASDTAIWNEALSKAKLDAPVALYDTERVLEGPGWKVSRILVQIPRSASGITDYMRVDARPAFADAVVADLLPMRMRDGRFALRRGVFLRDAGGTPPTTLGGDRGSTEAASEVAKVLVARAFREVLKAPIAVMSASQLAKDGFGWSMWRVAIRLPGGLAAADVVRRTAAMQSALGVERLLWRWNGPAEAELWAGSKPRVSPRQARQWSDQRDQKSAISLLLDSAWESAKLVAADGRTPHAESVDDAGNGLVRVVFSLPAGLSPDDIEAKLDRFRATSGYAYARVEEAPKAGVVQLLLGVKDPMPESVTLDWGVIDGCSDIQLPFGVDDLGRTVVHDLKTSPHILVSGNSGGGKSVAAAVLVAAALEHGADLVLADPEKGNLDMSFAKRNALAFATTLRDTAAAMKWVESEMARRIQINKELGVSNWLDIPEDRRYNLLVAQVDEFNSLMGALRPPKNPDGDPLIANQIIEINEANRLRQMCGDSVSKIAAKGRSTGITLILGAQALNANELNLLSGAGTLKRNVARLFLGAGNAAGNVSQNNIRDANRIIRSMGGEGMPKGRGIYERTGGRVKAVQCYWTGGLDALTEHFAPLPDANPIDLTPYLPATTAKVGVVEQPAVTPDIVTVDDSSDEDWDI